MKIKILSRWSSAAVFSVEASSLYLALEAAVLRGANLRGANLRDAGLRDANLRGADLGDADLGDADLGGADLGDANLGGANLGDADLRGADLGGANLRGADLGGAKVLGVATVGYIDGWATTFWRTDKGYRIQAGCHTFTLDEARAHYANRDARRGLYYLATEAWQVIARLQGWEQEPGADLASPGVTALLEETR